MLAFASMNTFISFGLKMGHVNKSIKKDEAKVVDQVDMEDIGKQKCFCRCWKSKSVSS